MCVFLSVYLFMVCAVGEEVRDQCYPPLCLTLLTFFLRVANAVLWQQGGCAAMEKSQPYFAW